MVSERREWEIGRRMGKREKKGSVKKDGWMDWERGGNKNGGERQRGKMERLIPLCVLVGSILLGERDIVIHNGHYHRYI